MPIAVTALQPTLAKHPNALYVVYGEEPVQQQQAVETLRQFANDYERVVFDIHRPSDWDGIATELASLSLFSKKRLLECRVPNVTLKLLEPLSVFPKSTPNRLVVITCGKLSEKTAGFKTLEKNLIFVKVAPLLVNEMLSWIQQQLAKHQLNTDPAIASAILEKTEGNVVAASNAIEQLALLAPKPDETLTTLASILETQTQFSVFTLVDALLSGSRQRTSQILHRLRQEGVEPILALWAITKELRTLLSINYSLKKNPNTPLSDYGVWRQRETLVKRFLHRVSPKTLATQFIATRTIDCQIKGQMTGDPWQSLVTLCLNLTEKS